LIGNVKIAHEGATLDCKRALLYKKENLFKAVGEVVIEQGDSIIQYSDFTNYDANLRKATSWGNVEVNDKEMKLSTDTLHFDRKNQLLFYPNGGTIKDPKNTLKSIKGTYDLKTKKFTAKNKVTIINPENKITSNFLDYYTNTKLAYLYGPSTIFNLKDSTKVYCERGFYNTNTDVSYFVKNAKLFLKERTVEGDSLYYDKRKGFASATNNIKVIDTVQNFVTKGNYAELFEKKDSLFIIKKAVAISIFEKDSMYVHGDTLLVTGKTKKRIVRAFHNVKIFKSDLQGKCDSLHSNQENGLTKMFSNPILWSGKSQMTGDHIQLLSNVETNKLDSLKILNNGLIIQKDSLAENDYNQIKGRNMYGKFIKNELKTLLVKGNAESIYYSRKENSSELESITKEIASDIEFTMENNEVTETKYFKKSEGKTYPPSEFPSNARKLRGFIWREDEQPKIMEDIFIKDNEPSITSQKINNEVKKAKKEFLLNEQKLFNERHNDNELRNSPSREIKKN
ncbi:OstA-like protein, partial [Tenacibaculum sp.]|nr:OstA-like protein [Tenacibaculum sp.]